jgi:hypothetical protein
MRLGSSGIAIIVIVSLPNLEGLKKSRERETTNRSASSCPDPKEDWSFGMCRFVGVVCVVAGVCRLSLSADVLSRWQ